MRFRDARVDSLCSLVRQAPSRAEARALILEIEEQVRRKMPVTFLVHRRRIDVVAARVRGFAGTTWQPLGPLEKVALEAGDRVPPER
jgi:ABC-type transport system substrate-binding protein